VEDDPKLRHINAMVLHHAGYHVDAAEDGAAGWNALKASRYDVLMTDNSMPKVTGLELIQKVRSEEMPLSVILASGAAPPMPDGSQRAAMTNTPTRLRKHRSRQDNLSRRLARFCFTNDGAIQHSDAGNMRSARPKQRILGWRRRGINGGGQVQILPLRPFLSLAPL
jgi:CheY-like chemotaxis protein